MIEESPGNIFLHTHLIVIMVNTMILCTNSYLWPFIYNTDWEQKNKDRQHNQETKSAHYTPGMVIPSPNKPNSKYWWLYICLFWHTWMIMQTENTTTQTPLCVEVKIITVKWNQNWFCTLYVCNTLPSSLLIEPYMSKNFCLKQIMTLTIKIEVQT